MRVNPVRVNPARSSVRWIRRRRRHFWWWFVVPAGSLGLATFPTILYAAIRTRSRWSIATAPIYLGITAWTFATESDLAVGISIAVCLCLGTVHALYLSWVFSRQLAAENASAQNAVSDPSVVVARATIARRHDARRILDQDPVLAAELRIGRPDLPRTYDDGGLVDVNHVPAETLVVALELPPVLAADIVELRELRSGFFSADELLIACAGLNPDRLDILRDRLVFVPRAAEHRRALD